MSTVREGDRINNYLLEAMIGSGSFGQVWRARHHVFDETVAIKIPTDPNYVRNLQREGVAVHGLRHPNIVRAMDLDPYADPPYLVMEFIDGPSLRAVIDRYRQDWPIQAAVTVMKGMLQALKASHDSGLIHRDVKPANVLLAHPIEEIAEIAESAVKVTDFGLGRAGGITTQSIMQSGSLAADEGRGIAGTLAYMSPEQKEGREVDGRSDLYSCGIVLFEMLTGERPQGTDCPSDLRNDVPPHLDEVFRRSYTRLEKRYTSAREMLEALEAAASKGWSPPPPPQQDGPMPPPLPFGGSVDRHCSSCGNKVEREDQFCIHCGRQLVASVPRCSSCQAYVHAHDRFCIFCGTDLRVLHR